MLTGVRLRQPQSSATQSNHAVYVVCCFSVYLGTSAARAALLSPSNFVCGVSMFTGVRLRQPQSSATQSKHAVYVVCCFSVYLGTSAARAALLSPSNFVCGVSMFTGVRLRQPQSSATQSKHAVYVVCCFSVYLGTSAARAALLSPSNCVCGVSVFTGVRLRQPQSSATQSKHAVYVVCCFSVYLGTSAARAALLSPSNCVCGVSVFTGVRLQ